MLRRLQLRARMALSSGVKLGPYKIQSPLFGAGAFLGGSVIYGGQLMEEGEGRRAHPSHPVTGHSVQLEIRNLERDKRKVPRFDCVEGRATRAA